jgi:dihydrodipicolinate synthase/N-acetylneuraminate lyase
VVRAVVDAPDEAGAARLRELRDGIERHPFQAALKTALAARGVAISADVRAPLDRIGPEGADAIRELVDATFVK